MSFFTNNIYPVPNNGRVPAPTPVLFKIVSARPTQHEYLNRVPSVNATTNTREFSQGTNQFKPTLFTFTTAPVNTPQQLPQDFTTTAPTFVENPQGPKPFSTPLPFGGFAFTLDEYTKYLEQLNGIKLNPSKAASQPNPPQVPSFVENPQGPKPFGTPLPFEGFAFTLDEYTKYLEQLNGIKLNPSKAASQPNPPQVPSFNQQKESFDKNFSDVSRGSCRHKEKSNIFNIPSAEEVKPVVLNAERENVYKKLSASFSLGKFPFTIKKSTIPSLNAEITRVLKEKGYTVTDDNPYGQLYVNISWDVQNLSIVPECIPVKGNIVDESSKRTFDNHIQQNVLDKHNEWCNEAVLIENVDVDADADADVDVDFQA
mgnify:CR=1 FL=1